MFNQIINEIKTDPSILPFLYKTSPQMFKIPEFINELQEIEATGFSLDVNSVEDAQQFLDIVIPFIHECSDKPNAITKSIIKSWGTITHSQNLPLIQKYHRFVGMKIMNITKYARNNNVTEELYR